MRSPPRPPHFPDGSNSDSGAPKASRAAEPHHGEDGGRPERGTLHLRRPIDARPDAGKPNAGKPDPFQLRAEDLAALDTVPSWLRPFTTTPTSRFTRTPDYLMRPRDEAIVPLAPPQRPKPAAPTTRLHAPARGPAAPRPPVEPEIASPIIAEAPAELLPVADAPVDHLTDIIEPAEDFAAMAAGTGEAEMALASETAPRTIRRIAQMIRTDILVPPARSADQDDLPQPPAARSTRRAEARAAEITLPDSVAPTVLPIEPPLRATVRVSFVWPVDDGILDEAETETDAPEIAELPPLPILAMTPVRAEPSPEKSKATAETVVPVAAEVPAPRIAVAAPARPVAMVAPMPEPVLETRTTVARPDAVEGNDDYEFPPLELLAEAPLVEPDSELSEEALVKKLDGRCSRRCADFGVARRDHRRQSRPGRHAL